MLDKLFNKPLEIVIGEQTLRFYSIAEIAYCLEGRTSLSATRLAELLKLPISELEKQEHSIAEINKSILDVLNDLIDKPNNIGRAMRELDTHMFSQDQGWREIIQAINKLQEENSDIRIAIITKYMKYLSTIEDTVKYILAEKKRYAGKLVSNIGDNPKDLEATWSTAQIRNALKESKEPKDNGFKRLPKNEIVSVSLHEHETIKMRLASHPCQININHGKISFVDDFGTTDLGRGENIIGRSVSCAVKIDPNQKYVSRTHLHVIVGDDELLQFIDTSAEGTFINADYTH